MLNRKKLIKKVRGKFHGMKINWLQWILVYVFWVITVGLGFLCLISARNLSLSILQLFADNRWTASAIDKMLFIILAVLWLVLVIFAEYYYREGVAKNILWKHFSLVMAIQLFCLSAAHFIPVLIVSITDIYWAALLLPGMELIGGITFFALHKFSGRRHRIA